MESNTFDQLISRLYTGASRRRMLGGVMGAVTAALAGGAVPEASAKSSSKRRRKSTGHPGGGAATDLVAVCHVTNSGEGVKPIRVRRRALRAHLAHGDFRYRDCCVNGDCDVPECFAAQCVHGACIQTQLPAGTSCSLAGPAGGIGGCTPAGNCVPAAGGGG